MTEYTDGSWERRFPLDLLFKSKMDAWSKNHRDLMSFIELWGKKTSFKVSKLGS